MNLTPNATSLRLTGEAEGYPLTELDQQDLQAEYARTGEFSVKERIEYQRIANSMRRHMKDVGLTSVKADRDDDDADGMSPLDYAETGGHRSRPRHSHRERLEE